MPELKPCPFCGWIPKIIKQDRKSAAFGWFKVFRLECRNQDCQIRPRTFFLDSWEKTIAAWNKRATEDNK